MRHFLEYYRNGLVDIPTEIDVDAFLRRYNIKIEMPCPGPACHDTASKVYNGLCIVCYSVLYKHRESTETLRR